MDGLFDHRSKNKRWLMLVAILLLKGIQDSLSEQTQGPSVPSRFRREGACQLLVKPLADYRIRQHIFIRKVEVKGPSIDVGPRSYLLDTRRGKALFHLPETPESLALFSHHVHERLL
jgi:hypothetical protein